MISLADSIVYPFSAEYQLENGGKQLQNPGEAMALIFGKDPQADLELTDIVGKTYLKTNLETGEFVASTDPDSIGILGQKPGFFRLEGDGNNKLFGTESAAGKVDENFHVTNEGTIVITGGQGIYKGASGELNFLEMGSFTGTNPQRPYVGTLSVTGSITVPVQAVPAPSTFLGTELVTSIVAVIFLKRLWKLKTPRKNCGSSGVVK